MPETDPWHADEMRLLDEVRQARHHWAFLPDVPGCAELLEIGRGGQGVVYRARESSSGRTIAVKVLLDGALASPDSRSRFRREIEIARALRHDNIVRIHGSGTTTDGHLYFTMDYVDGRPLVDENVPEAHELHEVLPLFSTICGAVLSAHQRGIVHRDLKGANILIDTEGRPRILDFGLATVVADAAPVPGGPTSLSVTGQILGSLPWASPEQLQGDPRGVDTRADIYALGVLLYRLTTGVFPHDVTENLQDTLERIVRVEPRRPRAIRSDIPDDLEAIMLRCLAKAPDDRYATVEELQQDVDGLRRGEPIAARRQLAWQRTRRAMVRYRWLVIASAAAAVVLLGVAVTTTVLYRRAVEAEQRAAEQAARARAVTDYIQGILVSADRGSSGRRATTLRDLLDRAAARLPADLAADPLARAEIGLTLGNAYVSLGANEQADAVLTDAVTVYGAVLDEERRKTSDDIVRQYCAALLALGKVRSRQGRLDEAERLQHEALGLSRDHPGAATAERIWVTIDLANVLAQRGRIDQAERLLVETVADADDAREPAARLQALHLLGRVRTFLGKYAEAEANLREARDGLQRVLGDSSILVARCGTSLAECLNQLDRHDEARDLVRAALDVHLAELGENHQHVAESLEMLAGALDPLGEHDEAEACLVRAVRICRTVFGERHTQLAHMLERLGTLQHARRRFDEAEATFRESLAIYEALLPAGHVDRLITRGKIATCHAARGRLDEASPVLLETTEQLRRQLGPQHPLVIEFGRLSDEVERRRQGPAT